MFLIQNVIKSFRVGRVTGKKQLFLGLITYNGLMHDNKFL